MDAEQLAGALRSDIPFSYPHPDERTKSLLVETSSVKLYEQELAVRLRTLDQNSVVTAIIGRARSGKTHFILHLDYLTNTKRSVGGICVYLPLRGEDLDYPGLIKKIVSNDEFRRRADELGIRLAGDGTTDDVIRLVQALQAKHGRESGVILAVDNLDEHFRQRETIARERGISAKDDMQSFLGLFRLLIGEKGVDKGLCVILSMTDDAFNKVEQLLTDPTLRERFDFAYDPTDPGRILRLAELSEGEAYVLVGKYMQHWANRNNLALPDLEACRSEGTNTFPFTKQSIQLIWSAGSFAGHLCLASKNAIIRKSSPPPKSLEELVISEADAAYALAGSAGSFPNFPTLKPRIETLIGGPEIEKEVRDWVSTVAEVKFGSELWKAGPFEAFHEYMLAITGAGGSGYTVDRDVTFVNAHSGRSKAVPFVIQLADGAMGISLVHGAVVDALEGEPISIALKNGQMRWGVFAHLGKEPGVGFHAEREIGIGMDLFDELMDDVGGFDFNAVVNVVHLDELSAWAMIRCRELGDRGRKQKYYGWIESRLRFLRIIEALSSASPRIRKPPNASKAGELLDRSGA